MLLVLLAAMSSTAMLVGAVLAASLPRAGFATYLLALIVGLVFAACNFWIVRSAGLFLVKLPKRSLEHYGNRIGQVFCVSVLLWVGCGGFVGFWAAAALLRLVGMK